MYQPSAEAHSSPPPATSAPVVAAQKTSDDYQSANLFWMVINTKIRKMPIFSPLNFCT
jgi:hypothetical protein